MTLRTWLILPAAIVVTVLSATGALLQADTLVRAWLGSTRQLSELAARQTTEFILLRLNDAAVPSAGTPQAKRQYWLTRLDNDPKLVEMLESSAAGANSISEISVVDPRGVVIASSNRARPGNPASRVPPLVSLLALDPLDRVRAVWASGREYDLRVPVGLSGDRAPLFVVQVLVSNALLRETLTPGFQRIVASGALACIVALLLVVVGAEVTRRNLRSIAQRIDRIVENPAAESGPSMPVSKGLAEFDAVQSKLTLMEGRVRGALHEAQDYRQRVSAILQGMEEAVVLLEGDRIVLTAGAVDTLLGREFKDATALLALTQSNGNADIQWGQRRLTANLDYITDGADPRRKLTLIRLRNAEGASEVESQLQVVNRLEAINRLTGGVAHEIKNPLNAIAARLALLESIVEGDREAEVEIRKVADEIQRLDRVVRTFLDFNQPLQLDLKTEFDWAEMAREVTEFAMPDAVKRGVSLQFSGSPAIVRGDRDLLKQALINIVGNAIEATPSGGCVRVIAEPGRVRVIDDGPGIPDEVRKKMFQLYFTTKPSGSGIGLAVAYRSLQLHGGDIAVETELGKGTTFELRLPAVQKVEAAA